jgi:hypothetical protein
LAFAADESASRHARFIDYSARFVLYHRLPTIFYKTGGVMRFPKIAAAAMLGLSAIALSGCAVGLPTQVSRYQAMPAPQGQSFFVVPANGNPGGLEFSRYATQVAQAMQAQGYAPAASPAAATMLVQLDYGVDEGVTEYDQSFGPAWGGAYYGRPYYSRYGYYGARSPFYYGWSNPYISPWSPYGAYGMESYTVYKSFLDLNIRRRADNASLFEGHARARSQTDNLGTLVPNLVEAMFTGFPGRSGETIKITVPPARKTN